jgi:hypothetical protein
LWIRLRFAECRAGGWGPLADAGALNEGLNGSNEVAGNGDFAQSADVASSATNFLIGVVYDAAFTDHSIVY